MPALIQKHAGTVRRLAFRRDTFQTFIFRSLALCGFVVLTLWSILVQQLHTGSGCVGTQFTILGHYSNSAWMEQMYSEFKELISDDPEFKDKKICFRLVIGEDVFDERIRPAVWNPQHRLWNFNAAASVKGYDAVCNDTTAVPLGFIAWKSAIDELGTQLASWDLLSSNETDERFYISHAHPNVTTGGMLGLMAAIKASGGNLTDPTSVYLVEQAEQLTSGYAPTDMIQLENLMWGGPDFAAGVIGFENTLISLKRSGYLKATEEEFNDELAMLYFDRTFWVTNPLCDLRESRWVRTELQEKLTEKFMEFALDPSRLNSSLIENGIRPMEASEDSSILPTEIWNYEENGVNASITKSESRDWNDEVFSKLGVSDVVNLLVEWRNVKKPVFLHLVLDVSKRMLESVGFRNRWWYIQKHLVLLPEQLEDRSIIHISCVAGDNNIVVSCSSKDGDYSAYGTTEMEGTTINGFHPSSNLTTMRDVTVSLITDDIAPSASLDKIFPVRGLEKVIDQTNVYLDNDESELGSYNYRVVIITGRVKGGKGGKRDEKEVYQDLVNKKLVGYNEDPTSLSVFSMLYYDNIDGTTGVRLYNISNATSGRFTGSTRSGLADFLTRLTYYI